MDIHVTDMQTIRNEDLETVERCASALGVRLTEDHWATVWKMLREDSTPYTVLSDMGLTEEPSNV